MAGQKRKQAALSSSSHDFTLASDLLKQQDAVPPVRPKTVVKNSNKRMMQSDSNNSKQRTFVKNITHQLFLRQEQHSTSMRGNHLQMKRIVETPWRVASWIDFPQQTALTVQAMAFDKDGVLLAVAYENGMIRVYDWDMVVAADLRGRNARNRQENTTAMPVQFIVEFFVSRNPRQTRIITFLEWNPFEPDQLAVGMFATGSVHLYDVAMIAASSRTMVAPKCRTLHPKKICTAPTEMGILFIKKDQAIITVNSSISCWDLSRRCMKQEWNFNWNDQKISSLVAVTSDIIAIGSSRGTLALLNHHKLIRPSFSTTPIPTTIKEWCSFSGLENTPRNNNMGILGLRVRGGLETSGESNLAGLVHFEWITACGWHLCTTVDLMGKRRGVARVKHHTDPVRCKHANTGEFVTNPPLAWSLPATGRVQMSSGGSSAFVFQHVPQVTQILMDGNKYVLGTGSEFERAPDKPTLLWADEKREGAVSRIVLSQRRGQPTCLLIHPNHEWIIVGTKSSNIYLINSRKK